MQPQAVTAAGVLMCLVGTHLVLRSCNPLLVGLPLKGILIRSSKGDDQDQDGRDAN